MVLQSREASHEEEYSNSIIVHVGHLHHVLPSVCFYNNRVLHNVTWEQYERNPLDS